MVDTRNEKNGRFTKGLIPWNKGLKGQGRDIPNRGRFKPKPHTLITCVVCGKAFKVIPARLRQGENIRFCSHKCKAVIVRGKNHPSWKGENRITPILTTIRQSEKYREWRQAVYIRDNFTCQDCGDGTGGNLEAHHIKAFKVLLSEAREYMPLLPTYDAAMIYSPLWRTSNGVTLCKKCHKKIPLDNSKFR